MQWQNDRCSGKDHVSWAYKTLFLSGCTDVINVVKHPFLNESNPDASNNSRNNLNHEHDAGRNLYIMAKLQVSSKVTDLVTCDVSKCLEDGVGKGPSWKHVSSNKFIYHCVWMFWEVVAISMDKGIENMNDKRIAMTTAQIGS